MSHSINSKNSRSSSRIPVNTLRSRDLLPSLNPTFQIDIPTSHPTLSPDRSPSVSSLCLILCVDGPNRKQPELLREQQRTYASPRPSSNDALTCVPRRPRDPRRRRPPPIDASTRVREEHALILQFHIRMLRIRQLRRRCRMHRRTIHRLGRRCRSRRSRPHALLNTTAARREIARPSPRRQVVCVAEAKRGVIPASVRAEWVLPFLAHSAVPQRDVGA